MYIFVYDELSVTIQPSLVEIRHGNMKFNKLIHTSTDDYIVCDTRSLH